MNSNFCKKNAFPSSLQAPKKAEERRVSGSRKKPKGVELDRRGEGKLQLIAGRQRAATARGLVPSAHCSRREKLPL